MNKLWRGVTEVGFIVFLFYANLLMGEFERTGAGQEKGLAWAAWNVFTVQTVAIGLVAAVIGYVFIESLRMAFQREARARD